LKEYEVGYRKPPKSGQVRKGEVRNPNGRAGKKKASGSATSEQEMLEHIDGETVMFDGKAMTRREALIRAQYMSALKGKATAIRFIDKLSQRREAEGRGGGVLALPCDNLEKWNVTDAFAQYNARFEQQRRNALRRSRRSSTKFDPKQPLPLKRDWEILADLENQAIEQNGRIMSMREVRLRIYMAFAAKGNRAAQEVIARIQNAPKVAAGNQAGVLLVPAMMPMDEWAAAAERQQAQFRSPQQLDELYEDIADKAAERVKRRDGGDG